MNDCQVLEKTIDSLQYYDKNVLKKIRYYLGSSHTSGNKYENSMYKLEAGSSKVQMIQAPWSTYSHYTDENSGVSLSKNDDNNFSLTRYDMQDNLVRVFFSNNVITFVYSNGDVYMKPIKCLNSDETQMVDAFRTEAKDLEQDGKRRMLSDVVSNDQDFDNYHESDTLVQDNDLLPGGNDDANDGSWPQQQETNDFVTESNNLPIVGPSKNKN